MGCFIFRFDFHTLNSANNKLKATCRTNFPAQRCDRSISTGCYSPKSMDLLQVHNKRIIQLYLFYYTLRELGKDNKCRLYFYLPPTNVFRPVIFARITPTAINVVLTSTSAFLAISTALLFWSQVYSLQSIFILLKSKSYVLKRFLLNYSNYIYII